MGYISAINQRVSILLNETDAYACRHPIASKQYVLEDILARTGEGCSIGYARKQQDIQRRQCASGQNHGWRLGVVQGMVFGKESEGA